MKKLITFLMLILMLGHISSNAQSNSQNKKFSLLSIQGGIDQARKDNFTGYTDSKLSGYNASIDFTKYFGVVGLSIGADYMGNQAPSYDSTGLAAKVLPFVNGVHYTTGSAATRLTRGFVGLGPSFKIQNQNNKLMIELGVKGGVTLTNGSALRFATKSVIWAPWMERDGDLVTGFAPQNWGTFYHTGYTNDFIATIKSQLRVSYFVAPKVAVNVGAYYNSYLGSKARYNYLDWTQPAPYWFLSFDQGSSKLSSAGVTAGVSLKFGGEEAVTKTPKKGKAILTVKVIDELTSLPLANASVTIQDASGNIKTATTDASGNAVFTGLATSAYDITGSLHDIPTTSQNLTITTADKSPIATLKHNDPRFTLQGKAINISTRNGEGNVLATLKNATKGSVKMSTSAANTGVFEFQLDANSDYDLVGKKAGYISNIEKVSTKGLVRSQTLYAEIELGIENVVKGKSIPLNKIYYDLDKSNIREDASSDLDKMVVFLNDNPGYTVEIASHTDSRGDDNYNLKLSQQRAEAVVKYLANKGVSSGRMTAKGYGETKLVNSCGNGVSCSEDQHQANRRTDFKVVGE